MEKIEIFRVKYLNNIVEQDHGFIKKIIKLMMGFKSFDSALAILDGIELYHILKKEQMKNFKNKQILEQFNSLAA